MRDICEFLGGRADKNFLGSGSAALVIEPASARLLFVQQWYAGLCDWAAGEVSAWAPDRIALSEPTPPAGAHCSHPPSRRWAFVTRQDLLGVTLEWSNPTAQALAVQVRFTGELPGQAVAATQAGAAAQAGRFCLAAQTAYSQRVPTAIFFALGASPSPSQVHSQGGAYELVFELALPPGATRRLSLALGVGLDLLALDQALDALLGSPELLAALRQDWNVWFDQAIPRFRCSDPYYEKLYYYRWWSLYTKMILARLGHFFYPAPREGAVAFEACVSYSGACVSVDELRWMRDPAWAFSTAREFFAPENMQDGCLSNHIWDWGIDGDESNQDRQGRSVPYQNYAAAAFYGALLVHPQAGLQALREIWPQLCSSLESYPRLFDVDQDGLYETYPWSNSAGQEWAARYLYFDPLAEIFRYARGRTYTPDGSRAAEDLELARQVRQSVVTDPEYPWPETAQELYRQYDAARDHRLAAVDQSTYACVNFAAGAALAGLLGDGAAQRRYAGLAEQTRSQICARMWHPQDAFFYDLAPFSHRFARVKSVTGFFPFWARLAGPQHLPMLAHLFNPQTFWTAYPLPSLPLDYEKYDQLQAAGWTYWNYCTWPRTTCHVVDGLLWAAKTLDRGLAGRAADLLDRYTRMHFSAGDVNRPNIAERYDPHSAQPMFENLDYNHSSWIDLILQHAAGLTPQDSDELLIDPLDMGWSSFSLANIRYRGQDIDIEYSRGQGLVVRVDGVMRASAPDLQKIVLPGSAPG